MATNRKARRDYNIIDTFEAGVALKGYEVKSLRAGMASLDGSYARVIEGEVFLVGVYIKPYDKAGYEEIDPRRRRKLLLKHHEIKKLYGQTQERGFTLIPLKIYFTDRGVAKIEVGLCRGRRTYDKKESLIRKELDKETRKRRWR